MKIVIYSINYWPELTGIGKYSSEMAEWLSDHGHDVRVITAPPYYPAWKVEKSYSSYKYKIEKIKKITIWRCPLYVPVSPSGLKRIVHLLSFAVSSFPVIFLNVFWKPDIVFVIEPPLFCAPSALTFSKLTGAKSMLHVQDFEVDAAFDLGVLSSPRLRRLALKAESWLMSKFDRVSTISTQMIYQLEAKSVSSEKQILFPNWVDIDLVYPMQMPGTFRKQLAISTSDIVFLYSGNMGEKQGLEIVIEAARQLADSKNIVFVMCGQGAAYRRLHNLADGLKNIYWLALQPLDKLNDLLNMADVHLLPQRADAADLVMPSKLTGMLASGRPVLATALESTQIAEVLESAGVIVPPENLDLFVNAIVGLAGNAEQQQQLGKNARAYAVNHLGRDAVLKRFEESLKNCVDER